MKPMKGIVMFFFTVAFIVLLVLAILWIVATCMAISAGEYPD